MADEYQTNIALTAIHHAAASWLEVMLAVTPRAQKQVQHRHDEWVVEMNPFAHEFAGWSTYYRITFLELLNGIIGTSQRAREDPEERNDLPAPDEVNASLLMHWTSYAHLRWIGEDIIKDFAGRPNSVGSARRAHSAQEWFARCVVACVDRAEWDGEGDVARAGVIRELEGVRIPIEQGRSPVTGLRLANNDGYEALPGLADTTRFPAFNAMLHRIDENRRAAEARAIRQALVGASQAARGTPSVDNESNAVEAQLAKLAFWTHKSERAHVVNAVRHALEELKTQGRPQNAEMKRLAIIAAINELRLSTERLHAYGVPARSLGRASAGRTVLSLRQQAQYGRRYAGL
ncbi:hypothetical protein JCM9279_005280 [Rhodotorula babjevae]